MDLIDGELVLGHADERTAHHIRGRSDRNQGVVSVGAPLVAKLQLSGNLGTMLVACVGHALETGDELVAPNTARAGSSVILGSGIVAVADVAGADFDQTETALGALLVEINQIVHDVVVVNLLDRHREHDEPVPQLNVADADRL